MRLQPQHHWLIMHCACVMLSSTLLLYTCYMLWHFSCYSAPCVLKRARQNDKSDKNDKNSGQNNKSSVTISETVLLRLIDIRRFQKCKCRFGRDFGVLLVATKPKFAIAVYRCSKRTTMIGPNLALRTHCPTKRRHSVAGVSLRTPDNRSGNEDSLCQRKAGVATGPPAHSSRRQGHLLTRQACYRGVWRVVPEPIYSLKKSDVIDRRFRSASGGDLLNTHTICTAVGSP